MKGELLPASIDLSMVIEDAPMDVEVDREGFERALPRLTVNARDAMSHGDKLLIQVKQAFPGHERGLMNGRGVHLPKVEIQVTDTGSKMTQETQSHMFEPFFPTKEMNVRLGLTAVYGIVKQSAGQVDVVSRPGKALWFGWHSPLYERTGRLLH